MLLWIRIWKKQMEGCQGCSRVATPLPHTHSKIKPVLQGVFTRSSRAPSLYVSGSGFEPHPLSLSTKPGYWTLNVIEACNLNLSLSPALTLPHSRGSNQRCPCGFSLSLLRRPLPWRLTPRSEAFNLAPISFVSRMHHGDGNRASETTNHTGWILC